MNILLNDYPREILDILPPGETRRWSVSQAMDCIRAGAGKADGLTFIGWLPPEVIGLPGNFRVLVPTKDYSSGWEFSEMLF